jgi:tryptophan synthase beta chain
VEAGGRSIVPGEHAARFDGGSYGMLHGAISYVLQDDHGQIGETHSVSAGLDYASVGPEHAYLFKSGRVEYTHAGDAAALAAFKKLSQLEGIIPALESAHAIAHAIAVVPSMAPEDIVIVNLSGRGDKDVQQAAKLIMPEMEL